MKATLPPAVARAGDAPAVESPRQVRVNRLAAFRAAFYREFWPYLPLALAFLAIVGMLAGLVAWDNTRRRPLWIDLHDTNVLMLDSSHLFAVLVIFVGALAGVVIGVFQGLADRAPALWGFIKHRPGGTVLPFAARVLAGLALYCIAAGIPVALLLIYAATHAMPFEWHFILPTSADFLGGVVWYLAGLLAVERHASIFGSRLLPMVGAVICTGAVCAVPQFAQALLVIGLAAAVYGAAAWGAQGYRCLR